MTVTISLTSARIKEIEYFLEFDVFNAPRVVAVILLMTLTGLGRCEIHEWLLSSVFLLINTGMHNKVHSFVTCTLVVWIKHSVNQLLIRHNIMQPQLAVYMLVCSFIPIWTVQLMLHQLNDLNGFMNAHDHVHCWLSCVSRSGCPLVSAIGSVNTCTCQVCVLANCHPECCWSCSKLHIVKQMVSPAIERMWQLLELTKTWSYHKPSDLVLLQTLHFKQTAQWSLKRHCFGKCNVSCTQPITVSVTICRNVRPSSHAGVPKGDTASSWRYWDLLSTPTKPLAYSLRDLL